MAKGKDRRGREKRGQEKLAKAQKQLLQLQERLAVVQMEGEDRVRVAQQRAEARVVRARKRVDRQAHVVAEREARLHAITGHRPTAVEATSPGAAADVLERVIADDESENGVTSRLSPGGAEMPLIAPVDSDIPRGEVEGHDPQY